MTRRSQVWWPEEGVHPVPNCPGQLDSETLKTAQKRLASPGARWEPANSRGSPQPCSPSGPRCSGTGRPDRLRQRLPSPPLLQTGLASLQGERGWSEGVERKGEEPGRPAGGACSLRAPHTLLSPRLAPTPARTARTPAPELRALLLLGLRSPNSPHLGCARPWSRRPLPCRTEDRRGRKGKAGTHTLAAARAHCTLAAARPRLGASGASLAPRLQPGTFPPPPLPRPRPRPHPSAALLSLARGKRQHPDNLQAVAQLVSTAEAAERCPGEVSFLRVPGPPLPTPLGGRLSGALRP